MAAGDSLPHTVAVWDEEAHGDAEGEAQGEGEGCALREEEGHGDAESGAVGDGECAGEPEAPPVSLLARDALGGKV